MEKLKLKMVKRVGIEETNSSSTHSVVICMDSKTNIDYWKNLDIDENNILHIHAAGREFGWEYFKTNSINDKLNYLVALYCNDSLSELWEHKNIEACKRILKSIFGVADIKFDFIDEYFKNGKDFYNPPSIDHQSRELIYEICESKETIKNFLLSENSWLYGGNDNSDSPADFYEEVLDVSEEYNAIATIDFGGTIGKLETPIVYPTNNLGYYCLYKNKHILENLYIDIKSNSDLVKIKNPERLDLIPKLNNDDDMIITPFLENLFIDNGTYYLIFTYGFCNIYNKIKNMLELDDVSLQQKPTITVDDNFIINYIKDNINNTQGDIPFKLFKVNIIFNKFGIII